MKRILYPLIGIAILSFLISTTEAALTPKESDEHNGAEAKPIQIKTVLDRDFSLKENREHVVLVNFFASWCPPCRSEIGQLTELHKKHFKEGLTILGLAVDPILTPDSIKDVKPMVENLKIPYPVALATEKIADDYHFKGIPTTIVIGSDGKIAKTFYGYHDAKKIEQLIQTLLPAKSPK